MSHQFTYNQKDLLALIADGDEAAFRAFFNTFAPIVRTIASKLLQDTALAADLVQDVFLRIWLNRDNLTNIEKPKEWVIQIAYYQCFNVLRSQKRQHKAFEALGKHQEQHTENLVFFEQTKRILKEGIAALPPQTQKVYLLSREEGMNIEQLAKTLGLAPQSVKNTLSRALKMLRAHLLNNDIILPALLLFNSELFF